MKDARDGRWMVHRATGAREVGSQAALPTGRPERHQSATDWCVQEALHPRQNSDSQTRNRESVPQALSTWELKTASV